MQYKYLLRAHKILPVTKPANAMTKRVSIFHTTDEKLLKFMRELQSKLLKINLHAQFGSFALTCKIRRQSKPFIVNRTTNSTTV